MSGRTGSHQLSNGLMVSGRPEQQHKERQPSISPRAVPYTGGDVKKSGELGKLYGIGVSGAEAHVQPHPPSGPPKLPSRPPSASQHNSGSARSGPNAGPLGPKPSSGPMSKKTSSSSLSGPVTPLQPTGLITSGPLGSNHRSGQMDAQPAPSSFKKVAYGSAVTSLGEEVKLRFRVSRLAMWVFAVVVVMGLVVGAFLMASVRKPVVLVAVVAVLIPAAAILMWNYVYERHGVLRFLKNYPNCELRGAVDGQYIKVTGVVTCGGIPLETSFQMVPRCVYVSSELYEYRGCGGKPANTKHRFLSWGCRNSEKYVARTSIYRTTTLV